MGDALQVRRTSDWALQGGPCGVGAPNAEPVPPICVTATVVMPRHSAECECGMLLN